MALDLNAAISFADLRRVAQRVLAWWGGELSSLVPACLNTWLGCSTDLLVIDLNDAAIEFRLCSRIGERHFGRLILAETGPDRVQLEAFLETAKRNGAKVALRLPAKTALRKTMTLPAAAANNLRQLLQFQIERQTPFRSEEVYFDYRIVDRAQKPGQIVLELTLVPRPVVDEAVLQAESWGIQADIVDVAGAAPINLLTARAASDKARFSRIWGWAAAAALLTIVALGAPVIIECLTAATLAQELDVIKDQAQHALALRQQLNNGREDTAYFAARDRKSPPFMTVLGELSQVLPDDTYLYELHFSDADLRISGYSSNVSALVGLLAASPIFDAPTFSAPVTHDARTERDRFELLINVKQGSRT